MATTTEAEKSLQALLSQLEKAREQNKEFVESWNDVSRKIKDSLNPLKGINDQIQTSINKMAELQTQKAEEIQRQKQTGVVNQAIIDYLNQQIAQQAELQKSLNILQQLMSKYLGYITLAYETFKMLVELGDNYDALLASNAQKQGIGKKQSEAQVALIQKSVALNNEVGKAFSKYAVTLKEAVESVQAINEDLGVMAGEYMPQLAIRSSELAASTGLSAVESSKFFTTLGEIGNTSFQTQENMAGVADAAAKAAGVPLGKVIKDVSGASANVRTVFRGNTIELIKQAAELRKIGSSLEQAAKSADSLLNFETSIGNELKASALLGKNINFNQSRRLFFEGKIADAEKALQAELERVGDIDKLNYFQRKALSDLTGKDINELQRIASLKKTQQKIDQDNPELAAERLKFEKELSKISGSKLEQEKRANEIAALENVAKERTKVLDAAKEQAALALGKALYPVVSFLRDIQIGILQVVTKLASFTNGWVIAGVGIGVALGAAYGVWKLFLLGVEKGAEKIGAGFAKIAEKAGEGVAKSLNAVGKGFRNFGRSVRFLKIPGQAIVAILVVTAAVIGLGYAFKLMGQGLGAAAPGLKVIGDTFLGLATILADVFLKTLDKVPTLLDSVTANIVKLSVAGPLLIVAGIGVASLGASLAMLIPTLVIFPTSYLTEITTQLVAMGRSATDIELAVNALNKLGGIETPSLASLSTSLALLTATLILFPTSELTKITTQLVAMGGAAAGVALAVAALKELDGIELPKVDIGGLAAVNVAGNSKNEEIKQGLQAVAQKLDVLTGMMAAGKIAVYMDRVKVSKELAEGTLKFGVSGQATNLV